MKNILLLLVSLLFITACDSDLDQVPPNLEDASALTDYEPVLLAAYGYHFDAVGPMAVFGDFRADNCFFDETPFTDFDAFNANLTSSMSNDFFKPFYAALYKSILSANGVIENSDDATLVGEAQFVRALSYFKLVQVFGDVSVNLNGAPTVEEIAAFDPTRKPKSEVLTSIIIPDLQAAMSALSSSNAADAGGRATSNAAQALLGKVYATMGKYGDAATELKAVIDGADAAGIMLQANFGDIFGLGDKLNSEILFATQMSSNASISDSNSDLFPNWYGGANTKADANEDAPIEADLMAAFAASPGDLRQDLTIDTSSTIGLKYALKDGMGDPLDPSNYDWIEIRLADVIMLYAEALNETGSSADDVLALLDPIRTRAGLGSLVGTASSPDEVRQAILDERRLEFALEGQRWFDLVRFDAAQSGILDAEMGESISSNYHIFPIPVTEVTSFDEIVQNPGY